MVWAEPATSSATVTSLSVLMRVGKSIRSAPPPSRGHADGTRHVAVAKGKEGTRLRQRERELAPGHRARDLVPLHRLDERGLRLRLLVAVAEAATVALTPREEAAFRAPGDRMAGARRGPDDVGVRECLDQPRVSCITVSPWPRRPFVLSHKCERRPRLVEWNRPALMSTKRGRVAPVSACDFREAYKTGSGTCTSSFPPSPSRPRDPRPKDSSVPVAVSTSECCRPQATCMHWCGSSAAIRFGREYGTVSPWPS